MQNTKIGNWKGTSNQGYIRRLVLVPSDDISYLPYPSTILGYDDSQTIPIASVPIDPDTQTLSFEFRPKSCLYNLIQNPVNDGHIYNVSIQGALPKLLAQVTKELESRKYIKWVAFFQDHNQNYYIAGTPDYPLVLSYGQSINDQTDTAIFLNGKLPFAPLNTTSLPTQTRTFLGTFSRAFA